MTEPTPEKLTQLRDAIESPARLTIPLIVSNVVIFFAALIHGLQLVDLGLASPYAEPAQTVFFSGMKVNERIADGQWWRLVSSMWVHLDMMHLAFNMYGVWVFGPLLEKLYGARRFLVLYLGSGIIAALCSYVFNDYNAGGASGALYGLVGVVLVFGFKHRRVLPEQLTRAFTVGMLPWVVFSIGIGFFEAIPFDNAAHLGGIFSGAALAALLRSRLSTSQSRIGDAMIWVLTIAGLAAVAATAVFWSLEAASCVGTPETFLQCYPEVAPRYLPEGVPQGTPP